MSQDNPKTTELLPCPFCGSDAIITEGDRVNQNAYCHGCDAQGPLAQVKFTQMSLVTDTDTETVAEQARVLWNRRYKMSDPTSKTTAVAGWWGRGSADSSTIFCAQNGWREATWELDSEGKWHEVSATLRPVVAIDRVGNVTLGDPRIVK